MRLQYTQKVTFGTQDSRLPLVSVPQLIGVVLFPTACCWEVTAKAGSSELKYVTRVK
jgi:hypothetical protein